MSIEPLSTALADAVEAVSASVLGARRSRGFATLTAVSEHVLVGTSMLARRPPTEAQTSTGTSFPIQLVGVVRGLDLAVFSTQESLSPITWNEEVRVGHLVVPIAFGPRATLGMVSQIGGAWVTPSGHPVDRFLHVDGTLPGGFGGGPLVGTDGSVVGINVRRLIRGGTTLSPATVRRIATTLTEHGSADPGFLGIGGAAATLGPEQSSTAGQDEALLVVAVESQSPAAGHLIVGDIVLRIDATPITDVPGLRAALHAHPPGSEVPFTVLSGGVVQERSIVLGERPSDLR